MYVNILCALSSLVMLSEHLSIPMVFVLIVQMCEEDRILSLIRVTWDGLAIISENKMPYHHGEDNFIGANLFDNMQFFSIIFFSFFFSFTV